MFHREVRRGEAGRTGGEALPAGRPAAGTAPCPERHLATGRQEPPGKRRARDRDGASGPAPHKGTEVIHANCTDQRKQNLRKNPDPENLPSGLPEGCTKPRGSALTGPRTGQRAGPGPQHRCERGGSGQCAAVSRQNRHGPQPLPHCQHPTVKPKLHVSTCARLGGQREGSCRSPRLRKAGPGGRSATAARTRGGFPRQQRERKGRCLHLDSVSGT